MSHGDPLEQLLKDVREKEAEARRPSDGQARVRVWKVNLAKYLNQMEVQSKLEQLGLQSRDVTSGESGFLAVNFSYLGARDGLAFTMYVRFASKAGLEILSSNCPESINVTENDLRATLDGFAEEKVREAIALFARKALLP